MSFLSAPITSVDAILAALAGGLIIGSELRGMVARARAALLVVVGRPSDLWASLKSFPIGVGREGSDVEFRSLRISFRGLRIKFGAWARGARSHV